MISKMKNHLFKTLIKGVDFFSPGKNEPKKKRKILIVSTTGLGDTLWGTPAVKAIKKSYPDVSLSLLTSPIGRQLFLHNPYIDQIFTLGSPAFLSSLSLLASLRREHFDTILLFHLSQRPTLPLCHLTKAANIVGTYGINKGLDSLLTHPLPQKAQHEIERRLEIARHLGPLEAPPYMELYLTPEEEAKVLPYFSNDFVVAIHPGAKDKFKQWNPSHFAAIGKKLVQEKGAKVYITGNQEETLLAAQIAKEIPYGESLAGKLPLRETAALIKKCNLFITNDTGPMHLAFALNTPTVALFSPTDPLRCGPYHLDKVALIQKKKSCIPCLRKKCRVPFCMDQISIEEVYQACLKMS